MSIKGTKFGSRMLRNSRMRRHIAQNLLTSSSILLVSSSLFSSSSASSSSSSSSSSSLLSSPAVIGRKLFTWGECRKSSLGLGAEDRDHSLPVQMPPIDSSGFLCVSSSLNSTGIVTGNGEIFMFGYSDYGQLGQPQTETATAAESQPYLSSIFGLAKSTAQWKRLIREPIRIKIDDTSTNFVQIACGNRHTAAIDDRGRLYTFGWTGSLFTCGALGNGRVRSSREPVLVPAVVESLLDTKIVQVSCGDKHTLCVTDGGEIYVFGHGEHGRLGTGHTAAYPKPVKLSYFNDIPMRSTFAAKEFSFAVSAKSEANAFHDNDECIPYGFGRNDRNQMGIGGGLAMDMYSCDPTPQPVNIRDIVDLGLSDADVLAVSEGGEIYHWGDRVYLSPTLINEERGIEEDDHVCKVDISSAMMCFVTEAGKVLTCSKTFGMKSDICSLGQGSVEPYRIAKKVDALDTEFVTDVICSDGRCLAVCQ